MQIILKRGTLDGILVVPNSLLGDNLTMLVKIYRVITMICKQY